MSIELCGTNLKDKYKVARKSTNKSKHNQAGAVGGKKRRAESGAGLQIRTEARKVAQVQTRENQMVLFITKTGKRTWVRAKDMR